MPLSRIPSEVIWSYALFTTILMIGLVAASRRGDWQRARGFDNLVVFGPLFYAAPLAAFGSEHFTLTASISSIVPRWIPWPLFWTYAIGTGFVLAGFSFVTRLLPLLSSRLVAMTFFLFVATMDVPAWLRNPSDRFAAALALRQLAFSGGALAFAATLAGPTHARASNVGATIARFFVAVAVLFYSFEQLMHGDFVPGIPLRLRTPDYVVGHAIWTYLTAVAYAVLGVLLIAGIKTRAAATWLGAVVLFVELVVYVPIAVVQRASMVGFNFLGDTLLFCGAVLLVAGAMPHHPALRRPRA